MKDKVALALDWFDLPQCTGMSRTEKHGKVLAAEVRRLRAEVEKRLATDLAVKTVNLLEAHMSIERLRTQNQDATCRHNAVS